MGHYGIQRKNNQMPPDRTGRNNNWPAVDHQNIYYQKLFGCASFLTHMFYCCQKINYFQMGKRNYTTLSQ